jgi:ketosteroid isomerase-like protein
MNKTTFFSAFSLCTLLFTACLNAPESKPAAPEAPKADMAKIKAEIQALETAWGAATGARDAATILAFYADDVISMPDDKPSIVGKAAVQKDIEESLAKNKEGSVTTYETLDVYGNEDIVTEVGKGTARNAAGEVTYTGKYMVVWEKRNGKWLVTREIYNDDAKEK